MLLAAEEELDGVKKAIKNVMAAIEQGIITPTTKEACSSWGTSGTAWRRRSPLNGPRWWAYQRTRYRFGLNRLGKET